MKNILFYANILFLFLFLLSSCNKTEKKDTIILKGKLKSLQKGVIVLEHFENDHFHTIDSIVPQKEEFQFSVEVKETDIYRMIVFGQAPIPLVLNPNEKEVEISIDGSKDELIYEIKGSKESNYYLELNQLYAQFRQKTESLVGERDKIKDEKKIAEIDAQYNELRKDAVLKVKKFIEEIQPSIVAIVACNGLDIQEEFEYVKKLSQTFQQKLPQSKYTQKFTQYVADIEAQRKKTAHLSIGKPAPDIELENPEGKKVKLSSLKGKLVLIDFWASWCKPCRAENPNVVKVYNQYKDKGFEIYGVSLDSKKEEWLKAIEKDGITWIQVSDLKFWQSEAAQTYQVQAIPQTYLIDKEGKIIAKDLRGTALENKIKEVLNL